MLLSKLNHLLFKTINAKLLISNILLGGLLIIHGTSIGLKAQNGQQQCSGIYETEQVTFTGPKSRQFNGLLTYPAGYIEEDRVPLVFCIHDEADNVASGIPSEKPYSEMIQMFSNDGYAMLHINLQDSHVGSEIFQVALTDKRDSYAYRMVLKAVEEVEDMGVAHKDSLCLMGWDKTGSMTVFARIKSERMKPAGQRQGLANLTHNNGVHDPTDWETAEMGGEHLRNNSRDEKPEIFYYIEDVTAPFRIIHEEHQKSNRDLADTSEQQEITTQQVLFRRTQNDSKKTKLSKYIISQTVEWFDDHLGRDQSSSESQ